MHRNTIGIVLVGLAIAGALAGPAAAGVLQFNRLCQQDFPDSRICTTTEVAETT